MCLDTVQTLLVGPLSVKKHTWPPKVLVFHTSLASSGQATWKCSKDPVCWKGEPNVKQCTSKKIQELTNQVRSLKTINVVIKESTCTLLFRFAYVWNIKEYIYLFIPLAGPNGNRKSANQKAYFTV